MPALSAFRPFFKLWTRLQSDQRGLMTTIFKNAFPTALTITVGTLLIINFGYWFNSSSKALSIMSIIFTAWTIAWSRKSLSSDQQLSNDDFSALRSCTLLLWSSVATSLTWAIPAISTSFSWLPCWIFPPTCNALRIRASSCWCEDIRRNVKVYQKKWFSK